jgi:ketosteroid isomerase-like protein
MDTPIKDFFDRFEQANASSDFATIGELYADTFLFGGPKGVQPVKKADFLQILPRMKAHYASQGLSSTKLHSVDPQSLDAKFLLVKVAWKMSLQSPSGASQQIDTRASYILERKPDHALQIVFQIDHQDLAAVVQQHSQ